MQRAACAFFDPFSVKGDSGSQRIRIGADDGIEHGTLPVVLLDDDNTVSQGSRAICFAKRTLEIFDRLGTGQELLVMAPAHEMQLWASFIDRFDRPQRAQHKRDGAGVLPVRDEAQISESSRASRAASSRTVAAAKPRTCARV